jgi:hypothetical protein
MLSHLPHLEEVRLMSRIVLLSAAAMLLSACSSSWDPVDHDGDGISALEGDCWDAIEGPEGSGLAGSDIYPGAGETFYDGIDQDCALDDDFDADGDGYVPNEYYGATTLFVPDSGSLPGGDCWDDPTTAPPAYTVVSSSYTDKAGTQLDWAQPSAAEVNPAATDTWYDGVDQDCAGDDDFDKDDDGYATESYPDQDGVYGDDCVDGNDLDDDNFAGAAASAINPDASEVWYDGTDQDCDDNDCDQDYDGYDGGNGVYCVPAECDDFNPDIYPDDSIPEVWYNGVDENCDGDDGDQDGDGYWISGYDELVVAAGGTPLDIPEGWDGDCWDVPLAVEAAPRDYVAVNGFGQPDADEVNPAATEVWYDDVDQDCAGNVSDFDADSDGYATTVYADRDGLVGEDCDDTDNNVFPGQFETYYDGTDDNCDGNDGDADGDGYWTADYESLVAAAGGTPLAIPSDCGDSGTLPCDGDCNDGNGDVHPDRLEDCRTTQDDDCDGETNFDTEESPGVPGDAISCTTYYLDDDRDAYGSTTDWCLCEPQDEYDVTDSTDCDDTDSDTYPGADEYCDGHDDDCDGDVDEDSAVDALTWYADTDGDGYGDPAISDVECYQPSGYELDNTDCDDSRALTNPGATEYCNEIHDDDCDGTIDEASAADAPTWYADTDGDGYGDPAATLVVCEMYLPSPYIADNTDCDDTDAGDYPGAPELIANNDDEDCDGGDTCYEDLDGDTFGSSSTVRSSDTVCSDSGESYTSNDCDDSDPNAYPAATEYCDGHDDDCDGEIDEDGSADVLTWYADTDADGYGDPSSTDIDCYEPTGYVADNTDCDDTDAGDYPGATEIVGNQDDEDCDGTEICYHDDDDDGWLDTEGDTIASSDVDCVDTYEGTNADPTTDCDDTDAGDYPGAPETVGNQDDEDCDGAEICYHDDDNDGYLDSSGDTIASSDLDCTDIYEGTNTDPTTDCDDDDAGDYPGATETIGNEDDEDCDGQEICFNDDDNDGYLDSSGDTIVSSDSDCKDIYEGTDSDPTTDCDDANATAYPGATEYCDGHDDDCDGEVDEDASADVLTWYADSDSDTFGDPAVSDIDCYQPTGYVSDNTDCDDSAASVYPGAAETTADGIDQDCDGGDTCYQDGDGDGYGTATTVGSADLDCADSGESTISTDCNDSLASAYPGATEVVADGVDQSCSGGDTCYVDGDGDGYGDTSTVASSDLDCSDSGEADDDDDCNDSSASIHPGATEVVADGIDQDCANGDTCYEDNDEDGYGSTGTVVSVDLDCTDTGESTVSTDCNDSLASAYPGATEVVADGVDQSCSGGDTCYVDSDGDSYGDTSTVASSDLDCSDSGEADDDDDCDDSSSSIYPGAPEVIADGIDQDCANGDTCYEDNDHDGYGSTATQVSVDLDCADTGESAISTDCDDNDDEQYPGAEEFCNGEDDNCDGTVDEDTATGVATWYLDYDGDGFGDSTMPDIDCDQPPDYVSDDTDCDDTLAAVNPDADEVVADGIDNDCDNLEHCYQDKDGDGYGTSTIKTSTDLDCADSQEASVDGDCLDTGSDSGVAAVDIYPGQTEVCDDADNDCDGTTDVGATDATTWWIDVDDDDYGVSSTTLDACDQPSGYVDPAAGTDCDDGDPAVYPGADEYCNGYDDDCDGSTDEADALDVVTWYADDDDDGYGDAGDTTEACEAPSGYLDDDSDCLDSNDEVYPGALEYCDDGLINDCDEPGGGTAGNSCPAVGDVIVSELMINPYVTADASGEWVELYNTTGADIDLEGMVIYDDGSNSHRITDSVVVPAGDFALLVIHPDALRAYDYEYDDFTLSNSPDDEVILATWGTDGTDGTVIDEVWYDTGWPFDSGYAMALQPGFMDYLSNDSSSSWAEAVCAYNLDNSGTVIYDMGTPGGANDLACPVIDQVDPSEIMLDSTEDVIITGTDLEYSAADVVVTVGEWGVDDELSPLTTSTTEVEFTAPSSASQGSADVVLYNGINVAILEDGFNWVELETAYIWWPIPTTHASYGQDTIKDSTGGSTLEAGETTEILYGRVYSVGEADCDVENPDLQAELGYGAAGTDPRYDSWTWVTATFNPGSYLCTANHAEYQGSISSLAAGSYAFTFRYAYDGGPWVYGELRGDYPYTETQGPSGYEPGEVLDLSQLGTFTVN